MGRVRQIDFSSADELTFLLFIQHDVLSRRQALRHFSAEAIRHRLRTKRWQQPHRAVYVTTTGELTREQLRWIALLAAGSRGALLAGRSALEVLGLTGFTTDVVHLLLADGKRFRHPPAGVVIHRTTHLPPVDTYPDHRPPRTAEARSVVDAAQWAASNREARTVIAMAFQQGKVLLAEIMDVLTRMPNARRSALIARTAADAAGGAHALAELDFLALSRLAGFPTPKLQAVRRDAAGRRRYLDVVYEQYGVHVEIDGAQHIDVRQAWADMKRQNEVYIAGDRVLRFPAWLIREHPDEVIAQVRAALIAAGWRP
jgi:very-short-patch-repair endonuclease